MPYSELMIRPMREELTRIGVEELRTPEQVDETLTKTDGTVMVVVNSICGCAAGKARPGIARALQHSVKPDKARSYFTGYAPSSPSIALLKDGELVYMMERRQIEGKDAAQVANELIQA